MLFDKTIFMNRIFRCKRRVNRKQETGNRIKFFFFPSFLLSFFFTLYSLLFTQSAFADDSNWGIQQQPNVNPAPSQNSQKVWEKEQNEKLYENYGSQDSPAFLNRENIDPATSEYEEKYDYEDDAPYNYDAGGN